MKIAVQAVSLGLMLSCVDAFIPSPAVQNSACKHNGYINRGLRRCRRSRLEAKSDKSDISNSKEREITTIGAGSGVAGTDFERQELKVIFETMRRNGLRFQSLNPSQSGEIESLAGALMKTPSPILPEKATTSGALVGKWRLEYSSEDKYRILPPDASVYNFIYDPDGGRLDSVLLFPRSPLIKSLRVVCDYKVQLPDQVIFNFKQIQVEVFWCKIPLPAFGDSGAFIEIQNFDTDMWIEQFEELSPGQNADGSKPTGKIATNIWRKIGTPTEEDKTSLKELMAEQIL